ncbi:MAG: hypothetical protein ACLPWF_17980 [Bryobacteraceae bacterium]
MQAAYRDAILNKVSAFTADPYFRHILGQRQWASSSVCRAVESHPVLNLIAIKSKQRAALDLGTEALPVIQRKVQLYLQLAISGEFTAMFPQPQFRVLLTANSERRLQNLRAAIARLTDKIFWLTTLDSIHRERFWSSVWLRPTGRGSVVHSYRAQHAYFMDRSGCIVYSNKLDLFALRSVFCTKLVKGRKQTCCHLPGWSAILCLIGGSAIVPPLGCPLAHHVVGRENRYCANKVNALAAEEDFSGMITAHNTAVAPKNQHRISSFSGIGCLSWFCFRQSQMGRRGDPVFA